MDFSPACRLLRLLTEIKRVAYTNVDKKWRVRNTNIVGFVGFGLLRTLIEIGVLVVF